MIVESVVCKCDRWEDGVLYLWVEGFVDEGDEIVSIW